MAAADVTVGSPQHDHHVPEGGVGVARKKIDGVIEIDVVIIIAIGKGADFEDAAHREAMRREGGVTEGEIRGVVSPEAAAGGGDAGAAGFADGTGDDLVEDEPVVEGLVPGAICGGDRLVVPAEGVEAVGAIDLYFSVLEEPAGGFDEAHVLILVVASFGGREQDQRVTGIAEYEHFELPLDDGGEPFMIFFVQIHNSGVTKPSEKKSSDNGGNVPTDRGENFSLFLALSFYEYLYDKDFTGKHGIGFGEFGKAGDS